MQMLVRLCREADDTAGEIDALSRLIALESINESAHRELMDAYARAGRYTDALRQYQQCRVILRRELDLSPEPATDALYRELMKRRRSARRARTSTRCRRRPTSPTTIRSSRLATIGCCAMASC